MAKCCLSVFVASLKCYLLIFSNTLAIPLHTCSSPHELLCFPMEYHYLRGIFNLFLTSFDLLLISYHKNSINFLLFSPAIVVGLPKSTLAPIPHLISIKVSLLPVLSPPSFFFCHRLVANRHGLL